MSNKIEIQYCSQCRWLMRSSWMAQEILTTFEKEVDELTLRPGTGGIFEILANGKLIWSRKKEGRFPEMTELKQRVRDVIAPDRDLGCIDRKKATVKETNEHVENYTHDTSRCKVSKKNCA